MHLSFRPARASELAAHFPVMGEAFAYSPALRPKVPALWAQWLNEGALMAHLIERHDQGRVTVEALGVMAFVRDGFVEAFRSEGRPGLREELVRRSLTGERIVLAPEAMRAANQADGLTLLFLADARGRAEFDEETFRLIDAKWSEALYALRGCKLKAIWHEVYGDRIMRHVAGCGMTVCEDWARDGRDPGNMPHETPRPYLLGITREEAKQRPGTHASFLFNHVAPQFGLTLRQQELLREAAAGATDDELASRLGVSASAVKKRWIAIYERVSAAMPGWLEGEVAAEARGAEKRRHLLNYLRQHPEELHPACAGRE